MQIKDICQKCIKSNGGCCTNVKLLIHSSEIELFRERYNTNKIPLEHDLEIVDKEKDLYLYDSGGERCMFLNADYTCSIYEHRPLVCRLYPLKWQTTDNFHIDLSCPLAHLISLNEITHWKNEDNNAELLTKMAPLNFNSKNKNYANITNLKKKYYQLNILDQ